MMSGPWREERGKRQARRGTPACGGEMRSSCRQLTPRASYAANFLNSQVRPGAACFRLERAHHDNGCGMKTFALEEGMRPFVRQAAFEEEATDPTGSSFVCYPVDYSLADSMASLSRCYHQIFDDAVGDGRFSIERHERQGQQLSVLFSDGNWSAGRWGWFAGKRRDAGSDFSKQDLHKVRTPLRRRQRATALQLAMGNVRSIDVLREERGQLARSFLVVTPTDTEGSGHGAFLCASPTIDSST